MQRLIGAVLAVALVAVILLWRYQSNRAIESRAERAHAAAVALCAACRDYAKHRAFFEEWSPDAHEVAREAAIDEGPPARFDESAYREKFLGYLAGKAQSSGMREVADELRRLQNAGGRGR